MFAGGLTYFAATRATPPAPETPKAAPSASEAKPSAPVAASAPASEPSFEARATGPALTWRTEGPARLPEPADLAACMGRFGGPPPQILPAAGRLELLNHGPTVAQRVDAAPEGATGLRAQTFVGEHPHAALAAHLALAACLAPGATALLDTDLGRRFDAADWPAPGADGSLDVGALFATEAVDDRLATRGLARLGLPELTLTPAPGEAVEAARRRLETALAAAVVAERAADTLSVGELTYTLAPDTVRGAPHARRLVAPAGFAVARPGLAPDARAARPRVAGRRGPKSAAPGADAAQSAVRPPESAAPPAVPTRPAFMPDYR